LPPKTDKRKSAKKAAKVLDVAEAKPYAEHLWKGIKQVFMCSACQHCEDVEDDMKLHVLKHVPKKERMDVLDKLVKKE